MHYGSYKDTITTHLARESVDSAHSAFLRTMGLQAVSTESTRLTCMNHVKRLASSGAGVNIQECWNATPGSDKKWTYVVEIFTATAGGREEVRKEIDSMATQIERSIEEAVPGAKILIQNQQAPSPM